MGFGVSAALIALAVAGCGGSDGATSAGQTTGTTAAGGSGKQSMTVAMGVQSFETLDPQMQASPPTDSITRSMYESLVRLGPEQEVEPLLATEWKNPSAKVWEFTLRDGVTFHDGAPLDGKAVVASFKRIMDPDNERTRASEYADVASVTAPSPQTVRFKLKRPWPTFPHQLAYTSGVIVSPKAASRYGNKLDRHPTGTGPYRYGDSKSGSVTVERFDDYWGDAAAVKTVKFVPVAADGTRELMLKSGQADIVSALPTSGIKQVESDPQLQVVRTPGGLVMHLGLNSLYKPLADQRVRQALNHAVDSGALVSAVLQGEADRSLSYLAPTAVDYRASDGYEYDPERAKQLLADAGYPDGFDLEIQVPSGRYPMAKETAEAIQGYLKAVGVRAKLVTLDFSALIDATTQPRDKNKVQAYLLGWQAATGEPSLVSQIVFKSDATPPNGWNSMFYANPKVDTAIDDAAVELDDAKRTELYGTAQALAHEDAPWLFLYVPKNLWGAKADIAGIDALPDGTLLIAGVR